MIIDSLENADKYNSLHPLFAPAFEWLKSQNLDALEDGTYQIQDGLKAIMSAKGGKTVAESLEKFECHQKAIDIQLLAGSLFQSVKISKQNTILKRMLLSTTKLPICIFS
jgi:YhcH/YjgK/YiaL family protein